MDEIDREWHLSRRDFQRFLAACESDEEPSDALIQAAERFKKKYANEITQQIVFGNLTRGKPQAGGQT